MRTLSLISVLVAVALGIPFEPKVAQVPPPEALQRSLVGDLLPVQGLVVEEKPAPRPEPGKELPLSAPNKDKKEQAALEEKYVEVPVNEVNEEPRAEEDVTEDNNEIEEADVAAPFEEVSLESELNEADLEQQQDFQEPEAETVYDISQEDAVKEPMQPLQAQEEYVEVPVNEVNEEPRAEEDATEDNNEIEEADVAAPFEEASLESELNEADLEQQQDFQEPEAEIVKDISQEDEVKEPMQPLQAQEEYVEVPVNEVNEEPPAEQDLIEDNTEIEELDAAAPFEELSLASELKEEDEEQVPMQETEAKYDFEQPIMNLEPLTDEEMQRDELLQVSDTKGAGYEEPVMFLEPEIERSVPYAVMPGEEEGPLLDALGEPLRLSDEYFPYDEELMRLEPQETEDQPQMLMSLEPVEHGLRSCSGTVLEGKCFQFFTNPKKASEAEYFCQQSFPRGHLASITSQNVHSAVMNLMRQNGGTRRTWVGGIRFLDTGRFVWLDGSHWSYADWLSGEPNNTADLEDCIEVLASGKLNDFTCWEPQAFICSYPYQ